VTATAGLPARQRQRPGLLVPPLATRRDKNTRASRRPGHSLPASPRHPPVTGKFTGTGCVRETNSGEISNFSVLKFKNSKKIIKNENRIFRPDFVAFRSDFGAFRSENIVLAM